MAGGLGLPEEFADCAIDLRVEGEADVGASNLDVCVLFVDTEAPVDDAVGLGVDRLSGDWSWEV